MRGDSSNFQVKVAVLHFFTGAAQSFNQFINVKDLATYVGLIGVNHTGTIERGLQGYMCHLLLDCLALSTHNG